jgi:hypothetical protein
VRHEAKSPIAHDWEPYSAGLFTGRRLEGPNCYLKLITRRVTDHFGFEYLASRIHNVDDLHVLGRLDRLLYLFIVHNRLENRAGASAAHLDLVRLRENDLAIEVHIRHHSLGVDDELVFIGAEILVLLQEFLGLDEVGMARHNHDLTLEVFPFQNFGAMGNQLRPDEALDHHLENRLVRGKTHLAHADGILLRLFLKHDRGTRIQYQTDLAVAYQLVSFFNQGLVGRGG